MAHVVKHRGQRAAAVDQVRLIMQVELHDHLRAGMRAVIAGHRYISHAGKEPLVRRCRGQKAEAFAGPQPKPVVQLNSRKISDTRFFAAFADGGGAGSVVSLLSEKMSAEILRVGLSLSPGLFECCAPLKFCCAAATGLSVTQNDCRANPVTLRKHGLPSLSDWTLAERDRTPPGADGRCPLSYARARTRARGLGFPPKSNV